MQSRRYDYYSCFFASSLFFASLRENLILIAANLKEVSRKDAEIREDAKG